MPLPFPLENYNIFSAYLRSGNIQLSVKDPWLGKDREIQTGKWLAHGLGTYCLLTVPTPADPLVRGLPGLAGCEPRTGASFFVCLLHAHGIETVPGEHKATGRLQRLAVYSAHSCVLFHLSLTQGLRLSWAGLGRAA